MCTSKEQNCFRDHCPSTVPSKCPKLFYTALKMWLVETKIIHQHQMIIWQENMLKQAGVSLGLFHRVWNTTTLHYSSCQVCLLYWNDQVWQHWQYFTLGKKNCFVLDWDAFPSLPIHDMESIIPSCTVCAAPGPKDYVDVSFFLCLDTDGYGPNKRMRDKNVLVCWWSSGRQSRIHGILFILTV